jgi:hypothetical protein
VVDPDGRGWASWLVKGAKVAIKGGSLAAEVSGIVDDVKTLVSEEATLLDRGLALGSLISEVLSPVSARDAGSIVSSAVRRIDDGADAAGGAASAANVANKVNHIFREGKNLEELVRASHPQRQRSEDTAHWRPGY